MIEHRPDTSDGNYAIETANRDPNWVPWTAQQTFLGVLLTLVPWIAFSLALSLVGGGSSATSQQMSTGEDLASAVLAFVFSALLEAFFLIAPFHYARRALNTTRTFSGRVVHALGLHRFHPRALLWIVGLMVLIYLFDDLYGYVITLFHLNIQTNAQNILQEGATQPLTVYGLLLASVVVAPFCEEIFFRGFLLPGLLKDLSPIWSILISSTLFAIAHLDPGSFIPLFGIGIALGFLRWRTGSTWPGIMLHMLNNALSSLGIILLMHNINTPF